MHADPSRDQPSIDPARDPFVGNLSVDDNIHEGVRVAIWGAIGNKASAIAVSVVDGVVTLTGRHPGHAEQAALHRAVSAVPGVRRIVDQAAVAPVAARAAPPMVHEATPFVHVVRFCGLDEASTGAAIRQAVTALDGLASTLGIAPPDTLVIGYRAPLEGAITLEIGFLTTPELAAQASGEFVRSDLPAGPRTRRPVAAGIAGLVAGVGDLTARGALAIWQQLPAAAFRPWRGHRDAELLAVLPTADAALSLRPARKA